MSFSSSTIWQVTRLWRCPSAGIGSESCKRASLPGTMLRAVDASSKAQRLLWTSPSLFETAEYHFYGALSHAASCDSASPDQQTAAFRGSDRSPQAARSLGGELPGEFREPRRAGGRGDRAHRRPRRSMPSVSTNRPSARRTQTALSTMRRSPTNSPRASTRHVVSRRSRTPTCGTPGTAISVGEPTGKVRQLDQLYPQLREEEATARSDEHDRGAGRTPGSRYRDQSLASSVGRDRSGKTDRHAHAHSD